MDQNLTYGISDMNTGLEIFTISFSKVLADIIFIPQSNMSLFFSTSCISDIFSRKRTYIGEYFWFWISKHYIWFNIFINFIMIVDNLNMICLCFFGFALYHLSGKLARFCLNFFWNSFKRNFYFIIIQ